MQVVYTGESAPETITKSLFLMGPSRRPDQEDLPSWRDDALDILRDKGYTGVIFCPENKDGKFYEDFNYEDQVDWEEKHLNLCDIIVCWLPRDLTLDSTGKPKLPAATTNTEWGRWENSGKMVFGAPPKAPKNDYIKHYATKYNVPMADTLTETLDNALEMLGDGAERSGGERYVPLFIWNTPSFQSWYQAQNNAGNTLNHAEVLYSFRPGYKDFIFLWILKVNVHIAAENRDKTNEFILARPDISCVCLWHDNDSESIFDTEVAIIREFRSPANTEDCFIRELASGSSPQQDEEHIEVAAEEAFQETGLHIQPERLKSHGARQLVGTLSSHKAHLYSVELDDEEMKWLKSQKGIVHGNEEDSERTFVEVYTVRELIERELTDWATLGMILKVIAN